MKNKEIKTYNNRDWHTNPCLSCDPGKPQVQNNTPDIQHTADLQGVTESIQRNTFCLTLRCLEYIFTICWNIHTLKRLKECLCNIIKYSSTFKIVLYDMCIKCGHKHILGSLFFNNIYTPDMFFVESKTFLPWLPEPIQSGPVLEEVLWVHLHPDSVCPHSTPHREEEEKGRPERKLIWASGKHDYFFMDSWIEDFIIWIYLE